MKVLVVYDSNFGNTKKIALAVKTVLNKNHQATALHVEKFKKHLLEKIDLLIVGTPTHAFRPSEATKKFLASLEKKDLENIQVAAFDTRFTEENIAKHKFLKFMVKLFGFAAKPLIRELEKKGGEKIAEDEGFYVEGRKGPLLQGEMKRAETWALKIIENS